MSTCELGSRLVMIGGPLLIAAGLTLAVRSWSLTDGWIATAIALVIAQGIPGSIIYDRLRALRSALEAQPGKKQPAVDVSAPTADLVLHAGSGASVVVIAEILLLMSVKPAGSEILWSLFGMAALAGLAVWRAPRPSRAPSPT